MVYHYDHDYSKSLQRLHYNLQSREKGYFRLMYAVKLWDDYAVDQGATAKLSLACVFYSI